MVFVISDISYLLEVWLRCFKIYRERKLCTNGSLNVSGLVGLFIEQGPGNTHKDDQVDYKSMGHVSSNATDILISTQAHQKKASDKRLSQRPSTAIGVDGGINLPIHKNAMKATGIQKDKKEKREEAKLLGKGIRIAATLWKVDSSKNNKLVEFLIWVWTMILKVLTIFAG